MTFPIGMIAFVLILVFSMRGMGLSIFMNTHAIVLVVFGTLAILALCTPWSNLKLLGEALRGIFRSELNLEQVRQDLFALSRNKNAKVSSPSPLIVYAQDLWQKGVDHDVFVRLVTNFMNEIHSTSDTPAVVLRNAAKYPPSLGMLGTVIGMISLFSGLGSENRSSIGPLLALAMTATFYGLIVSNAMIMPLADRLQLRGSSFAQNHTKILKIILLIHQGEAQKIIEDELNGVRF